jgi:hypothetical protein
VVAIILAVSRQATRGWWLETVGMYTAKAERDKNWDTSCTEARCRWCSRNRWQKNQAVYKD